MGDNSGEVYMYNIIILLIHSYNTTCKKYLVQYGISQDRKCRVDPTSRNHNYI